MDYLLEATTSLPEADRMANGTASHLDLWLERKMEPYWEDWMERELDHLLVFDFLTVTSKQLAKVKDRNSASEMEW
jgi:hypothetical protein